MRDFVLHIILTKPPGLDANCQNQQLEGLPCTRQLLLQKNIQSLSDTVKLVLPEHSISDHFIFDQISQIY